MKAIIREHQQDEVSSDIVLKEGRWPDGAVVKDRVAGLRLELQRTGVWLLESPDWPAGVKVPVQFLPAIWGREDDEPLL